METPSVAYMKEYFAKAVELERHVHTLRGAMEKANEEMGAIYEEEVCEEQLSHLDQKYADKASKIEMNVDTDRKNLPKFKRRSIIMLAFTVIFGGATLFGAMIGYAGTFFENIMLSVGGSLISGLGFFITMPFLALFIVSTIRASRIKSRINGQKHDLDAEKMAEKEMLLGDIDNSKYRVVELAKSKTELEMIQDMIASKYKMATEALRRLYGKNLVAPKYHNFRAMAAFYDYLYTGRCIAVFGPDGVIDTYEDDVRIGIMLAHLSRIEDVLVDTNIKMGYLCDQAELANNQLAKINSNLAAIKISSAATAANTAEIASYCRSIDESVHRIDRFFF